MSIRNLTVLMAALILTAFEAVSAAPINSEENTLDGIERPYILLNGERLLRLRELVKQPGRVREAYLEKIKMNADRWVEREIVIPERTGHFHHYVCSADSTRLEAPEDQDYGELTEYRCPECGETYSDERVQGGRRYYEHQWLMKGARDLALTGAIEQDKKYQQKAAEILIKYADAYPGPHTNRRDGGIWYQSLDEAVHVIPMAQAYDLIYESGVLSEEDKEHIEQDFFLPCAEGISKCGFGGNWGSWHLSGVGVVGLAIKHQPFIELAEEQFKRQIKDELGSDGLWPESVHTYHFYPLRGFISLAEAFANTGNNLYEYEPEPGRSLRAMFESPVAFAYPNMQIPAINDGWYFSYLPADQYEVAWARFKEPKYAWILKSRYAQSDGFSAGSHDKEVIWRIAVGEPLPEVSEVPDVKSHDYENLGVSALRIGSGAEEKMMTFDYGRMLGHGQLDKMGITYYANEKILAADYGTPSYGSSALGYYRGTTSHNTIVVDGKNQAKTRRQDLLLFGDTPEVKVASARAGEVYPGVDWRRTVMLFEDYAVVVDDLQSTATHSYDWFLHAESDELSVESSGMVAFVKSPYDYKWVGLINHHFPDSEVVPAVWKDDGEPILTAYTVCEREDLLSSGHCPAETTARNVPLLVHRKHGTNARFAAVLSPEGSKPVKKVTVEKGVIRIEQSEALRTIELTEDSLNIELDSDTEPLSFSLNND